MYAEAWVFHTGEIITNEHSPHTRRTASAGGLRFRRIVRGAHCRGAVLRRPVRKVLSMFYILNYQRIQYYMGITEGGPISQKRLAIRMMCPPGTISAMMCNIKRGQPVAIKTVRRLCRFGLRCSARRIIARVVTVQEASEMKRKREADARKKEKPVAQ